MSALRRFAFRVRTAAWIGVAFVRVRLLMRRHPLPELVRVLAAGVVQRRRSHHPVGLGRAVVAVLRIGPIRARCLVTSLVLYRLLMEEGYQPELVIGILPEAPSPMAHAWIEIGGQDVGPPPGEGHHRELMRFS